MYGSCVLVLVVGLGYWIVGVGSPPCVEQSITLREESNTKNREKIRPVVQKLFKIEVGKLPTKVALGSRVLGLASWT